MFKAGQLLRAIILDSASSSSLSNMSPSRPIAQSHLTRLRVGPTRHHHSSYGPPDPWSLSQDGDSFVQGMLYVPDNQEVRLDILRSHHDHRLAGHPGSQDDKEYPSSVLLA